MQNKQALPYLLSTIQRYQRYGGQKSEHALISKVRDEESLHCPFFNKAYSSGHLWEKFTKECKLKTTKKSAKQRYQRIISDYRTSTLANKVYKYCEALQFVNRFLFKENIVFYDGTRAKTLPEGVPTGYMSREVYFALIYGKLDHKLITELFEKEPEKHITQYDFPHVNFE